MNRENKFYLKKSEIGKISFIVNLGLYLMVAIILLNNFVIYSENVIMGAIHELVAGTLILAIPSALIISIISFYKDGFVFKSYSFLALLLSIGLLLLFILPLK